jgi:hypothetical protein
LTANAVGYVALPGFFFRILSHLVE